MSATRKDANEATDGARASKPRRKASLAPAKKLAVAPKGLGQATEPMNDDAPSDKTSCRARIAFDPVVRAVAGGEPFNKNIMGAHDFFEGYCALEDHIKPALRGDFRNIEETLTSQANTLDLIFNSLARRAGHSDLLPHFETYLRLALKAQSQSRATLETLATIKTPPTIFAKQANVTTGPQQVNNGLPSLSRAGEAEIPQNKLLEVSHGERLDTGTASTSGRANQDLETVGAIDWAEKPRGKGNG